MIYSYLIHLGFNMWGDAEVPGVPLFGTKPYLRCDKPLWDDLCGCMSKAGINMLVIDLGEGIIYDSCPELAVKGSWTKRQLKEELDKLRRLGIEPIPKLNFSACHDAWLGPYSRAVSTPEYYRICANLIHEVIELFDKPRFFHIGYDEETAKNQIYSHYVVIRQHELWWHDFLFFVNEIEKSGVQPWMWSDYIWNHKEDFLRRMPRSVLQSNWYYGHFTPDQTAAGEDSFSRCRTIIDAYLELDRGGFSQVPAASTHKYPENFADTINFCNSRLNKKRLIGYMQTVWHPTLEAFRDKHLHAIENVAKAIKNDINNKGTCDV